MVRADVESEMNRLLHAVNQNVAEYERLQMLVIASTPWTMENGCLTPTMKIKRSRIEADLEPRMDAWYASKTLVIWS